MSANGIAHLVSKQLKQVGKLNIAEAKRQGKTVATDGTISGSGNTAQPFYRSFNQLDIDLLPTKYSGNAVVDNAGTSIQGRPWEE